MKKLIIMVFAILFSNPTWAQKKSDVALTPPMGWNTWNYFHCDVSEDLIKEMADAMVSSGMKDAGYEYVVIDDCWQVSRDENGVVVADPEHFPSGIEALADYIHSLGLKMGIYSDAGKKTCQERPGSLGFEKIDAETYQAWGIDYLKYDWCHNGLGNRSKNTYPVMAAELEALDREIVFSMCNWGRQKSWTWAGDYAHLWRTTFDIKPDFKGPGFFRSVMKIVDKQQGMEEYAGPGGWNDPDMLQVGNGDLTYDENVAHFSLWCMMAAPLMAGNDLRNMPDDVVSILTNKEAIAINQDVLGRQSSRVISKGKFEVHVKELSGGEWAVCLLNHGNQSLKKEFNLHEELGIDLALNVRDIWNASDLGDAGSDHTFEMPMNSVVLLRVGK